MKHSKNSECTNNEVFDDRTFEVLPKIYLSLEAELLQIYAYVLDICYRSIQKKRLLCWFYSYGVARLTLQSVL